LFESILLTEDTEHSLLSFPPLVTAVVLYSSFSSPPRARQKLPLVPRSALATPQEWTRQAAILPGCSVTSKKEEEVRMIGKAGKEGVRRKECES
jgi:hypothetical protein